MCEFAHLVRGVGRNRNGSEIGKGEQGHHHLDPVVEVQGHLVAPAHACRREAPGGARDEILELLVGQTRGLAVRILEHQPLLVRGARDTLQKEIADGPVADEVGAHEAAASSSRIGTLIVLEWMPRTDASCRTSAISCSVTPSSMLARMCRRIATGSRWVTEA
ncbi:unannotated protein [freshwater metagenome]|uniref:Unannotated protein n=1 Tax=freshwater metagenome TaxID=449393 RepID=A0A6J7BQJ0_9ZZZZ